MSFPINDYDNAVNELRATVADRDAKGRNETNDFYQQFPHGNQDLTFELKRRVERILGAEKIGDMATVYGDTLDLANYAIFSMMVLNKARASQTPVPTRSQTPSHAAWQEALRKFDRFAPENCSTAPPLLDQMEDSTSS